MQKKLIVLALAGLASSAAFAQTNVTIYGVMDEYVGYGSASNSRTFNPGLPVNGGGYVGNATNTGGDQAFSGLQSGGLSGSRLGFKGEEGLGNGLKAVFVFELGTLDPTSSANSSGTNGAYGNLFTKSRQSYVGLTGGWGTAIAGRLQTPGYDGALKFDPMAASAFSPTLIITSNNGSTINAGDGGRANNTVAYVTPNFSGFSGELVYSFGEQTTGSNKYNTAYDSGTGAAATSVYDKAQNIWGIGLNYDNGPLAAAVTYHNINNLGGTTNGLYVAPPGVQAYNPDLKQQEWQVAGSYDFKMAKLFASYQYLKQDNFINFGQGQNNIWGYNTTTGVFSAVKSGNVLTNGNSTGNLWNIGVNVPVGANGVVKASYTHYSNSLSYTAAAAGVQRINYRDQSVQAFGLDYEYSLSKRTTAYAGYSYLDNGSGAAYGYSTTTVTPSADNSAWNIGAGLRHTF